jgi:DNA repair exonuclease SbcCD ATPase subunit
MTGSGRRITLGPRENADPLPARRQHTDAEGWAIQENLTMVCKMVKKGLLGAALTAGGLYLVFGPHHAANYVKTAYNKVRERADDAVSIQFKIDAARNEIAALEPAILENREIVARSEVDVDYLKREIGEIEKNLAREKAAMVALRDGIKTGDLKLVKGGSTRYTVDDARAELSGRLDHFRNVRKILEEKQVTLALREKAVAGARLKLKEMDNKKRELAVKVEQIQARLQAIEAAQEKNEFNFDDSALSRAKQSVAELEKRLEVKARLAEMEGHYPGSVVPTVDPDRDVIKEFDAEFGGESKPADKSL